MTTLLPWPPVEVDYFDPAFYNNPIDIFTEAARKGLHSAAPYSGWRCLWPYLPDGTLDGAVYQGTYTTSVFSRRTSRDGSFASMAAPQGTPDHILALAALVLNKHGRNQALGHPLLGDFQ